MKACKKCKKQVANKAKICKYCGADVTKSKIIKKPSNTPAKKTKTNAKNKTTINKKVVNEKPIVVDKKIPNKKTDIIEKEKKTNVNKKDEIKKNLKTVLDKVNFIEKNKKKTKTKSKTKTKTKSKVKPKSKKSKKKTDLKSKINTNNLLDVLNKTKNICVNAFKKSVIFLVSVFAGILYGISYAIDFVLKSLDNFVDFLIKVFAIIGKFIAKSFVSLKSKLSVLFTEKKVKNRIKKRNAKIAKVNNIARKEEKLKKEEGVKRLKELKEPDVKERRMLKPILITAFVLGFIGGFSLLGLDVYRYFSDSGDGIATVSQKATRDKIFTMKDVISYNDVDYRVMKVETSMGNSYKAPKEGNQFLIVTVYIKNNGSKKAPYSYENWTMSNSKGEEKKRFFSSINVDDALYSGQLVIGGIKTGSMVFEQPINDSKLRMNYYELKVDENGNEVLDQAKRVFSVSIKVPETKKDTDTEAKAKEVVTTKRIS